MIWARMLAYITGTVDQELLLRNEYLAAENRILRAEEILAGAKGTAKPAEDVPAPYDHATNLTGTLPIELGANSLILWVCDVLMNDTGRTRHHWWQTSS